MTADIVIRCTLARRAEVAALALRWVADAIEHARPGDTRAAGRLEACRAEAMAALARMADTGSGSYPDVQRGTAIGQRALLLHHPDAIKASECREWAAAWDAFAAEVDP